MTTVAAELLLACEGSALPQDGHWLPALLSSGAPQNGHMFSGVIFHLFLNDVSFDFFLVGCNVESALVVESDTISKRVCF